MKLEVGVCEAAPQLEPGSREWNDLGMRVRQAELDLFLMNEMPFGSWVSAGERFDPAVWERSCSLHERGVEGLADLRCPVVLGSRPRNHETRRVNEAFIWQADTSLEGGGPHTKQYLPDEEGYYEARWFEPGPRHFRVRRAGSIQVGFLICTEVMFNEHARHYGRAGAEIIAVPRAVGRESLARWLVAMQMAAIVSGCYVLSSNRAGVDVNGQRFGGCGWIVDPTGKMIAETSRDEPVVSCEIDTDLVHRAQREYPCYVAEGAKDGR